VTDHSGQNPEALQDLPAIPAEIDPQPEHSPATLPHEPTETGAEAASADVAGADQGDRAVGPAADEAEAVAAPVRSPAPRKAKSESPRSRKPAAPVVPVEDVEPKSENMNWYILKVQSNREESIREGLLRRVAIQGLNRFFGEVIVPTEKVTEFKGGKKRVIKRKLYPGYIVVHMEINEDTWFLVRETPGIGDFTGASGVPTPMLAHEVERIVAKQEEKSEKAPDLKIPFIKGDRVKIIEGNFENFEGEVETIDKTNGRVTVMITIFNRTTPVEFEYWQVESV
jgi:transcription termination/antitermination protein NusG